MKKICVLILFIITFCQSFAWDKVEMKNEFDEPIGKISIAQMDVTQTKGAVMVGKDSEKNNIIKFSVVRDFIGGEESLIKIKIDNNNPIKLYGYVYKNNVVVESKLPNNLFEEMKKGKIMKALITKYDEQTILLQFDLGNFEESYKMVK